ncbi:TetR family transcriptional regulator [Actinoplanes hulinensis]|uniref:TetR family transcriptional regulator n=1 Tax=Actinoplanes hulinensis TaxID=1144547 RepID=A0ABS7B815_9ACTN|nr:TetR family transcriptional regulator [Actinoplanes hulinensis]MBW6437200.1 TetR family transcriptional regulator [Actinoplanes hulinensis]
MTGKVDGRAERARATRARITAAATTTFAAAGYATTSISAIAAAAGVSEQTVYYSFGNKRAVLVTALDQAIAGDDEPIPTLQRSWVHAALAEADPRRQIERQVEGAGEVLRRAARLLAMVRGAAADPELAEVAATTIRHHREVQRVFAAALASKTILRTDEAAAADTAVALLSPETYLLLTEQLGWTHDRWREWAADCLARAVIGEASPPAR